MFRRIHFDYMIAGILVIAITLACQLLPFLHAQVLALIPRLASLLAGH